MVMCLNNEELARNDLIAAEALWLEAEKCTQACAQVLVCTRFPKGMLAIHPNLLIRVCFVEEIMNSAKKSSFGGEGLDSYDLKRPLIFFFR